MSNNKLTKSYTAEAAIAAYSIVRVGAADFGVLQASAVGDSIIGVTTEIASLTGEVCDVVHSGIAEVKLAGAVTRGLPVTCNAAGLGVVAAPAAGTNNRIIGYAQVSGVAGDVIPVLLSLGTFQG